MFIKLSLLLFIYTVIDLFYPCNLSPSWKIRKFHKNFYLFHILHKFYGDPSVPTLPRQLRFHPSTCVFYVDFWLLFPSNYLSLKPLPTTLDFWGSLPHQKVPPPTKTRKITPPSPRLFNNFPNLLFNYKSHHLQSLKEHSIICFWETVIRTSSTL